MLEYLFGSQLRAKLIGFLMTHADERYFVRQIAALIHYDPTNVSRELTKLAKSGILISHRAGREKYYQANKSSSIFEELRSLAIKTSGLADVLRTALNPLSGKIRIAFIYGSFAAGRETAASDVDVMVIGEAPFKEVVHALQKAQSSLNREVNPTVYPVREFSDKMTQGHHFIADVVKGKKIFLIGDEHELARLASKPVAD